MRWWKDKTYDVVLSVADRNVPNRGLIEMLYNRWGLETYLAEEKKAVRLLLCSQMERKKNKKKKTQAMKVIFTLRQARGRRWPPLHIPAAEEAKKTPFHFPDNK